jgi:HEAT repeat protein
MNKKIIAYHRAGELLPPGCDDKQLVMEALEINGLLLQFVDNSLKNDPEVLLTAMEQNGLALEYAPPEFKNNKEVVLVAVRQNGQALKFANASLKIDREVVLAAVEQDGLALQFADDELKADRKIFMTAVRQNRLAYQCISTEALLQIVNNIRFLICDQFDKLAVRLKAVEDLTFLVDKGIVAQKQEALEDVIDLLRSLGNIGVEAAGAEECYFYVVPEALKVMGLDIDTALHYLDEFADNRIGRYAIESFLEEVAMDRSQKDKLLPLLFRIGDALAKEEKDGNGNQCFIQMQKDIFENIGQVGLVDILMNNKGFVHDAAAAILAEYAEDTCILQLCGSADQRVSGFAREALADRKISDESTIPVILQMLAGASFDELSDVIINAIASFGVKAVPGLIELCANKESSVRAYAADALGKIGPAAREAVSVLINMLKDMDEDVQEAAMHALTKIKPTTKEAFSAIKGSLNSSNEDLRIKAAALLAEIAPNKAVPLLIKQLTTISEGEKIAVITVLGNIGSAAREAISPLTIIEMKSSTPEETRMAAQEALRKIKQKQ